MRKDESKIRIDLDKRAMIEGRYGSIQAWLTEVLEREFTGTHEAVIVKRPRLTDEVRPEDF